MCTHCRISGDMSLQARASLLQNWTRMSDFSIFALIGGKNSRCKFAFWSVGQDPAILAWAEPFVVFPPFATLLTCRLQRQNLIFTTLIVSRENITATFRKLIKTLNLPTQEHPNPRHVSLRTQHLDPQNPKNLDLWHWLKPELWPRSSIRGFLQPNRPAGPISALKSPPKPQNEIWAA